MLPKPVAELTAVGTTGKNMSAQGAERDRTMEVIVAMPRHLPVMIQAVGRPSPTNGVSALGDIQNSLGYIKICNKFYQQR